MDKVVLLTGRPEECTVTTFILSSLETLTVYQP
jgi:hypothetical protein